MSYPSLEFHYISGNNDFDFIAHEIGHLLEYSSLDDKNLLPNVLLVQPMKEFYSSLCEIRALESNKNKLGVIELITIILTLPI